MSLSVASRDRDYQFRGDRSVGSCLSSASRRRKSKRFAVDGLQNALYLPNSLRVSTLDCDKSLQELDETVASVTKYHNTKNALINGERSPTSVSQDITGGGQSALEAEQVLLHLSQPIPLNFRRVESGSVRSSISRSSKSSKTISSRGSGKKRKGTLEEKVCQTILSAASDCPASTNRSKDSNQNMCRSAQFILTDLLQVQTENNLIGERLESHVPKISLRPRECQASDNASLTSEATSFQRGRVQGAPRKDGDLFSFAEGPEPVTANSVPKPDPPSANLITDLDTAAPEPPRPRTLGDIIRDADTESETSAFFVFDAEEEQATNFTLRRDNTMSAPSECTGTLEFSMDDSMLQYSSTNETSTFSPFSPGGEENFPQFSSGLKQPEHMQWNQETIKSGETDKWTMFDKSPFKAAEDKDDFGFGAFSPFGDDEGETEKWPASQLKRIRLLTLTWPGRTPLELSLFLRRVHLRLSSSFFPMTKTSLWRLIRRAILFGILLMWISRSRPSKVRVPFWVCN